MVEKKKVTQKRKSVKKSKEWRPHSRQIKMVQLLNNPEDRRTKEDKCKEVGVTPKTLCEWMKNPNFIAYRNAQMDKFTDGELAEVWKAHLRQCKRGNMDAIKSFYKMKELDPEIKIKLALLDLERQKNNKTGALIDAIAQRNQQIQTLAELINDPVPDRHIEDFEEDDGDD
jgi:hypothetical protein